MRSWDEEPEKAPRPPSMSADSTVGRRRRGGEEAKEEGKGKERGKFQDF